MGRRSDHSREELKELILTAAADIVEHDGIQALTARKIAKKIGYTVGTLYHVFQNFDDLLIHLNTITIDEMASQIQSKVRNKRSARSIIKAMAENYVQYATDHPYRWRLVFEHQGTPKVPEPRKLIERRDVMFEMVADAIRQLSPDMPPQEVAHTATALWSGIHGICILALTGKLYLGGAFSMNKLVDTLIDSVISKLEAER